MESCLPVNGQVGKKYHSISGTIHAVYCEAVIEREDHWTGTKNVYANSDSFAH